MMIPQVKRILYATDLTKNSSYAFYFAVDMARKHQAKIVVLHCIPSIPPEVYYEGGLADSNTTLKKVKEKEKQEDTAEIKMRLQGFCQKAESQIGSPCVDLVSDLIVKEGYPVEEILNTADAERCDVIVLGTHGKGWLKQAFLGSVALSVLERTRKPVFIAPLPSEKASADWAAM
jgi:nucleotide-binding universal stress UspA family protein